MSCTLEIHMIRFICVIYHNVVKFKLKKNIMKKIRTFKIYSCMSTLYALILVFFLNNIKSTICKLDSIDINLFG